MTGKSGRPPKHQDSKVETPVRCLVTQPVLELIRQDMEKNHLNLSDFLRIAILNRLESVGLASPTLHEDDTFKKLFEVKK